MNYTVTLSEQEMEILIQMLDSELKANGVAALHKVVAIYGNLSQVIYQTQQKAKQEQEAQSGV